MKDARATVRKVKRVRKSYARKIQILTVGEQRARVMERKLSLLYSELEKLV